MVNEVKNLLHKFTNEFTVTMNGGLFNTKSLTALYQNVSVVEFVSNICRQDCLYLWAPLDAALLVSSTTVLITQNVDSWKMFIL